MKRPKDPIEKDEVKNDGVAKDDSVKKTKKPSKASRTKKTNTKTKNNSVAVIKINNHKHDPDLKKEAMLICLKAAMGNVFEACHRVGISRALHYRWMNEDENYKTEVDDIQESLIDLGESALLKNVISGRETSIIFFLKTKGKSRGYVERSEVDVGGAIPVNFDKSVFEKKDDDGKQK